MLNKLFLSKIHVNRFRIKSTIGIQHLPNMYRRSIRMLRTPSICRHYRTHTHTIYHQWSTMSTLSPLLLCLIRCPANDRSAPRFFVNQRKVGWKGHSSRHHRMCWVLTNGGAEEVHNKKSTENDGFFCTAIARYLVFLFPFYCFFFLFFFSFRRVLAPRFIYLLIFLSSVLLSRFVGYSCSCTAQEFFALWISLLLFSFLFSTELQFSFRFFFVFPSLKYYLGRAKENHVHFM